MPAVCRETGFDMETPSGCVQAPDEQRLQRLTKRGVATRWHAAEMASVKHISGIKFIKYHKYDRFFTKRAILVLCNDRWLSDHRGMGRLLIPAGAVPARGWLSGVDPLEGTCPGADGYRRSNHYAGRQIAG